MRRSADIGDSGATTTSHTATGLTNGTEYGFRIHVVNAGGSGTQSDVATTGRQSRPHRIDLAERYPWNDPISC